MLAGPPTDPVPVPQAVLTLAAGKSIEPIWLNEIGGMTFRLTSPSALGYVKWTPVGSGADLVQEREKLEWAIRYTPVPRVIDSGKDDDGAWLLTEALNGDNAVAPRWKADPACAVAAIGVGLRSMHDDLPINDCPFSWSTKDRISALKRRAARRDLHPSQWSPQFRGLRVWEALAKIEDAPPPEALVVCHGDACAPNTIVDDEGQWIGHVDMGRLGIGDRWADLAVAAWSTEWNFGPGWDHLVYESYGLEPDEDRIQYFRLLWDLG
jgi:kanamycin kinase